MHAWLKLCGGLIKYYPYNVLDQTTNPIPVKPSLNLRAAQKNAQIGYCLLGGVSQILSG